MKFASCISLFEPALFDFEAGLVFGSLQCAFRFSVFEYGFYCSDFFFFQFKFDVVSERLADISFNNDWS